MKIRNEIHKDLSRFEYDVELDTVWQNLSSKLPDSKNASKRYMKFIWLAALTFALSFGAYTVLKKDVSKMGQEFHEILASLDSDVTSQKILAIQNITDRQFVDN